MQESCKGLFFIFLTFSFLLVLSSSVSAIQGFGCAPSTIVNGGDISCTGVLETLNAERNLPYNLTFWNDTAQTQIINGCSFLGTTLNIPNPPPVVETCLIPFSYGASTTSNAELTIVDVANTTFNISGASTIDLVVNTFRIPPLNLIGTTSSLLARVTHSTTGNPIDGAECTGSILKLVGGDLITIKNFEKAVSTFDGFIPMEGFLDIESGLEENTDYIFGLSCNCIPNRATTGDCLDRTNGQTISNSTFGLDGVSTTTFNISAWLSGVNTITDKSSYTLNDNVINVCANLTNMINKRLPLEIHYNIRCDGNDSSTNRIIIDHLDEIRGIDPNLTQNQCAELEIINKNSIQNKQNICYAATEVSVLSNNENIKFITYSTTSDNFTLTSNSDFLNLGGNTMVVILFLMLCFAAFFIWVGIYKEDGWSLLLSAFLIVFVGVYVMRFGIDPLNDDLTRTFAVILIGLGAYIGFRGIEGTGFGEAFPRFGGRNEDE